MDKDKVRTSGDDAEENTFFGRVGEFILYYKWQIVFTALVIAFTAAVAVPVYRMGDAAAVRSLAADKLEKDIETVEEEYGELSKSKEQIEKNLYNLNSDIDSKSHINKEIEGHEEQLTELSGKISAAQKTVEELDRQIDEKEEESRQSGSSSAKGKKKTLSKGEYSCPEDFKEGSYVISGDEGTILLYDASGKLIENPSLSSTPGHEFTIQLKEDYRFIISQTVTIQSMN